MAEPKPISGTLNTQKILQQLKTDVRKHRLRMELHALHLELPVTQAHDCAVGCFGRDFKRLGQRFPFDDQRVVARGGKILRQTTKHRLAVMVNLTRLAMHHACCSNYASSERRPDRLVPQAHTEDWNIPRKVPD